MDTKNQIKLSLIQFFILVFFVLTALASDHNLVKNTETYRRNPYDVHPKHPKSHKHHKSCPYYHGYDYNIYKPCPVCHGNERPNPPRR